MQKNNKQENVDFVNEKYYDSCQDFEKEKKKKIKTFPSR